MTRLNGSPGMVWNAATPFEWSGTVVNAQLYTEESSGEHSR
ncbi:hypothetical protein AVEN_136982-1, partial [Araneus ventricosus]